jgi:hypothetical protein
MALEPRIAKIFRLAPFEQVEQSSRHFGVRMSTAA